MIELGYRLKITELYSVLSEPLFGKDEFMATSRESAKEGKKRKILDAAVKAFGRNGYHRTRISDIARAANVADGTVYLYFEGKEQILGAIFHDAMEQFMDLAEEDLEKVEGALPRLRRILELHLRGLGDNRELATVFQIELRHSALFMGRTSRGPLRRYFRLLQGVLEEGIREGAFSRNMDVWFATKCIFGIVDEAATNWILSGRNYRLHSMIDPVMDFVQRGIGAGGRSAR